ncbi:response regulator [Kumtagia ephedrae]|uniref:response regulator n=1 Tax=Kumtagia ephedrae TaxID=2116701 RepID=UPI001FE12558|nr:response regulator [Mesorhizobium ephedrae]
MTSTTSGPNDGPDSGPDHRITVGGIVVDPLLVLVAGKSRINAVVVSRIVERCGLRPVMEQPETAFRSLRGVLPALVILDGGTANADCAELIEPLARARSAAGRPTPGVILLSTGNFDAIDPARAKVIDAVVSKPILPEVLQPVVRRLVGAE